MEASNIFALALCLIFGGGLILGIFVDPRWLAAPLCVTMLVVILEGTSP